MPPKNQNKAGKRHASLQNARWAQTAGQSSSGGNGMPSMAVKYSATAGPSSPQRPSTATDTTSAEHITSPLRNLRKRSRLDSPALDPPSAKRLRSRSPEGPVRRVRSNPYRGGPKDDTTSMTPDAFETTQLRLQLIAIQEQLHARDGIIDSRDRELKEGRTALDERSRSLDLASNQSAVTTEKWDAANQYWREREVRLKSDKSKLRESRDAAVSAAQINDAAAEDLTSERAELARVRAEVTALTASNEHLSRELREVRSEAASQHSHFVQRLEKQKRSTHQYRMRSVRAKATSERERGLKREVVARVDGRGMKGKRGSWSTIARMLARAFKRAGCSAGNVGKMMQLAARTFSGAVIPKMSRRTVDRAIGEAGIGAVIQLGDEIRLTEEHGRGLTVSDDGTSHRGKNIVGRHITVKVPNSYAPGADQDNIQVKTRFAEVATEVNHKSVTQVNGWKTYENTVVTEYNLSPMSARLRKHLDRGSLARVLVSKMQDHSNDAKGSANGTQTWSEEARIMAEGIKVINKLSADDREHGIFARLPGDSTEDASDELLELARLAWALELGLEVLDQAVSEDIRDRVYCFIAAFCGSHKELRAGEAFYKAMRLNLAPEIPRPLALPNAYNRAAMSSTASSDARAKAETETSGGGVKLASLIGLVLHHTDTKRGYQDVATDFFEQVTLDKYGKASAEKYAQTTATRFQSYFKGALWIVRHAESLEKLIHIVADKRTVPSPSNIENNILCALVDVPTLTEIVCMALYYLLVSVPFMRIIRKPGLNYFDCKPIYDKMHAHIDNLLSHSEHLIFAPGLESRGKELTYDGYDWLDLDGIRAVVDRLPNLPNIQAVWHAGLLGARDGWRHFAVEFKDGGRIARMSVADRRLHFAPAVNDHNEGILGAARQYSFKNAHANWRSFTDQATVARNDTEAWMERNFEEEDYDHLKSRFREKDASGEARAQREAQLKHDAKAAADARDARIKKMAEERARMDALLQISVARDEPAVMKLTNPQLKEQLRYHRVVLKKSVGAYSKLRQSELQTELLRLIPLMNVGSDIGAAGASDKVTTIVERLPAEPGGEDDDDGDDADWEDVGS